MSLARMSCGVLASSGLLLCLTAAPAEARPSPCPTGAQPVAVAEFNSVFDGPLWAPVDQDALESLDRNGDGLLCSRVVYLPSEPPGLAIPEGETNVVVLTVDTPGGRR